MAKEKKTKKYDSNMKDFLKTLGEGLIEALRNNPNQQNVISPFGKEPMLPKPPPGGAYGSFVQDDGYLAGSPAVYNSEFTPLVPSVPQGLRKDISRASWKSNLPPRDFSALLHQESGGYNPDVMYGRRQSGSGATGVGQFMPGTLDELKRTGYQDFNPNNPNEAVYASAHYLDMLKNRIGKSGFYDAAKAYNAGAGNYQKYGGNIPFKETINYIERIKELVNANNNKSKN